MPFLAKHLPDVIATLLAMAGLWFVMSRAPFTARVRSVLTGLGWALLAAGLLLRSGRIAALLPLPVSDVVRLASFLVLLLTGRRR